MWVSSEQSSQPASPRVRDQSETPISPTATHCWCCRASEREREGSGAHQLPHTSSQPRPEPRAPWATVSHCVSFQNPRTPTEVGGEGGVLMRGCWRGRWRGVDPHHHHHQHLPKGFKWGWGVVCFLGGMWTMITAAAWVCYHNVETDLINETRLANKP